MGIIQDSLIYKLMASLKIQNFWPQFMEAVGQEMELQKVVDDLTHNYNDIYNLYEDDLIALCRKFGYNPNLSVDNSLSFIIQEAELIPFKIKRKSTYSGYEIYFKEISKLGNVYCYYWNGYKLIRAVRWSDTFDYINSGKHILSDPFIDLYPDKNFSQISAGGALFLDAGQLLDEEIPWFFDENPVIIPSKRIGIEYAPLITQNDGTGEAILYEYDFRYLDQGVQYNRRCPIIPYAGTSLNFILSKSGAYNSFLITGDYSVPDLKIRTGVSHVFRKATTVTDFFQLDNSPVQELDETLTWRLDGTTSNPITIEDIAYMSMGGGVLNLPKTTQLSVLDATYLLLAYTFDDLDSTDEIKDHSILNRHGTLHGSTYKVDSIIGKGVNFNGSTYVDSDDEIAISGSQIYTLSFWINPNADILSSSYQTVFTLPGFLQAEYRYSDNNLLITVDNTYTGSLIVPIDTESHILIEIDPDEEEARIYFNTILTVTISITGASYSGNYFVYIGASNTPSNYYQGLIDEFYLLNRFFTTTEKGYLYNDRLSCITHLADTYYRTALQINEIYANDTSWWGIQSFLKGNSINDYFLFNFSVGTTTYVGTLATDNIYPHYFAVTYDRLSGITPVTTTVYDNGAGELQENDWITGTIDYLTGNYSITTYRDIVIPQEILATDTVSSISTTLDTYIRPSTFIMYYVIGSTSYSALDNGLGDIVEQVGFTTIGTLNYTSGALSITFPSPTLDNSYVTCQYTYRNTPDLAVGTTFTAEYKTRNYQEVTEVALENINKEVLAYATFPRIQFNSLDNYLGVSFMIKI